MVPAGLDEQSPHVEFQESTTPNDVEANGVDHPPILALNKETTVFDSVISF